MNDLAISPVALLASYCSLILVASLAGGWIPLVVRLTHTRLQIAISFVSGLMLGVGFLHMLPHAWHQLRSIDRAAAWLLAGFLMMFFVQRFFHFHHHDVPPETTGPADFGTHVEAEPGSDHRHHHPPDPGAEDQSLAEQSARRLSWTGAALGLMFHTVLNGIALAASVEVGVRAGHSSWLLGVGTFLVIFLHKPFDALAIGTLMARSGSSKAMRHLINGLFALGIPIGVMLFYFGADSFSGPTDHFLGIALAFAAGTFVCIAASDLLPELQFHEHDRFKLSLALLAGLAFAAFIGQFESTGHDRHDLPPAEQTTEPATK